ncbi:MAG: hypothetical protein IK048_05840 [Clostridia bacterium]|nr:hypothetical protein [Clostridia bacterium]
MNRFLLLTKKQIEDSVPQPFKRNGNRRGLSSMIVSTLLMLLLIAVMATAFVAIFGKLSATYVNIKINRLPDVAAREYELMTMCYFALILVFVCTSTAGLSRALFESGDLDALVTMPFSANDLFFSKLASVYIKQTAISIFFVTAINFTFFVATNTLTAYGGLVSFAVAFALPLVPLAISSVVVLPYYLLKRSLGSRYLLYFLLMTVVVGLFLVGYSYVFTLADALLDSGKISTLFNERTMAKISQFVTYAYPANIIANLLLERELGKSFGIFVAINVVATGLGIVIVKAIFTRALQARISLPVPHSKKKRLDFTEHSKAFGLFKKEFLSVIRTPSYSYMFFTTAAVVPIMVFFSARIGLGLVENLVGEHGYGFEISTFIVLLYGTLNNTFCSTNVSRDGSGAITMKALPYSPTAILSSKVAICSIVSFFSIAVSCIILGATGLERPIDAFVTFLSAIMIAAAQIFFATRLDLMRPHFSNTEDGEIKEANSTVSTVISLGLLTSFAIGAALLSGTIRAIVDKAPPTATPSALSYVLALVIPAVVLAAALTFFFVGLKRAYSELNTEV